MRFGFEFSEPEPDARRALKLSSNSPSSTRLKDEEELKWVPLQHHPVFSAFAAHNSAPTMPTNVLAWDGASRLYLWDSNNKCVHRLSIRSEDPSDSASLLAATPSTALHADVQLDMVINKISVNRNGAAMLLAGSDVGYVMRLPSHISANDSTVICRTNLIGFDIYVESNIRALKISWHPYSDTHVGILSSDSVFRLFNLSSSYTQPEQEYYLQPVEPGRSRKAASICPVDFSFCDDHLWDRFSVFILFSDGSVYIICPVVPFGSVYTGESILELYNDARTFGLKSVSSKAVSNSSLAINWLEATFPELAHHVAGEANLLAVQARPYALFDASISLQGPLQKVCHVGEEDSLQVAECEGRAVSFLCNSVGKDLILVIAWSSGQLQIDALADEIQPIWFVGSLPRLRIDPNDGIQGVAMICESVSNDPSAVKLGQAHDHSAWLGHPPPLLRLAIVDLALRGNKEIGSLISMLVDPVRRERIYSLHERGVDSVVLNFLPFKSQINGWDETMRIPSVYPVIDTCQGEFSTPSPLCGLVALLDSFGCSWIVGLTFSFECVVIDMDTPNPLPLFYVDKETRPTSFEGPKGMDAFPIISKELLSGPKVVLLPTSSPHLRSVAESIEGRSTLNQYIKIFSENYVEYAHKVYFELKYHHSHLKKLIDDQQARLHKAQQKLLEIEEKQNKLEDQFDRVINFNTQLEERLHSLKNLPGEHERPLSKAEKNFKSELDRFRGMEWDSLHSSIEALNARLKRYTHSSPGSFSKQQKWMSGRRKNHAQDDEISLLRSSIERLSLVNKENLEKVKLVETAIRSCETALD